MLDTARFRSLIAEGLEAAADAGHGPDPRRARRQHGPDLVDGRRPPDCRWRSSPAGIQPRPRRSSSRTRGSGAEVIKLKGGAGFAVGLSIRDVIHAVALDQKRILPVSSLVDGPYGIRDVCLVGPHRRRPQGRRDPARDRALAQGRSRPSSTRRRSCARRSRRSSRPIPGRPAGGEAGRGRPAAARSRRRNNGSRPVRVTMGSGRRQRHVRQLAGHDLRARAGEAVTPCRSRSTASSPRSTPIPNCREFILADAKDADMALRPRRAGPVARDARRRGPLQDPARISRPDAADHPAGPRRHHADVRQLEPRADVRRAPVRRLARHARDPGQRHDRHPPRAGIGLRPVAPLGRSGRPASTTFSAGISIARPRSGRSGRTWASTA